MPDPDFSDLDFSTSIAVDEPASIDQTDLSDLDLSTASPVHQSESVLDEDRGIVFDVPTGTDGKEQEFLIKTQHEKRDAGNFLGMDFLGDIVVGGAKGFAAGGLDTVSNITEVMRTALEANIDDPGDLNVSADDLAGMERLKQEFVSTGDYSKLRAVHHAGVKKFQEGYDAWVASLDLKPSAEGAQPAAFEFMAAGTSTIGAIGLTVLTKRPDLVAPLFGLMDAGSTMKEGREAGASPEKRLTAGAAVGAFTTITEGLGGVFTLRHLSLNKPLTIALREAANNAFQEALQTGFQETVSTGAGFKKADIVDSMVAVGKSALYGAFWGGTVAGVSTMLKKGQVKTDLTKQGLSPEQADKVIDVMTEEAFENKNVEKVVADIWRYEASPQNITPEQKEKNFKEIDASWKALIGEQEKAPAPDKSATLEKIARGGQMTDAEATAFPEFVPAQRILKKLDEQIAGTKDRDRRRVLRDTKQAVLDGLFQEPGAEPAAASTAESAPPVPAASGADRSVVAEKVARGLALTEEERASMPDLAELEDQLDLIDSQLGYSGLSIEERPKLERERAGLIAQVTFERNRIFEVGEESPMVEPAPEGGSKVRVSSTKKIDKVRAEEMAAEVGRVSALAERKRVQQEQKEAALDAKAKIAFSKKNPEASILESEALSRSLERQAAVAKQAVKSERERVKQGELGEKAKESFKTRGQRVEDRILKSDAMRMLQKVREQSAREGALFKKRQIEERIKLVRAIKNADIAGILAADRHKIEALQELLPNMKTNQMLRDLNDQVQAIKAESKEKFNALKEIREAQHRQRLEYLLNELGFADIESVEKGPKTSLTNERQLGKETRLAGLTAKRVFTDLGPMATAIFYASHNRTYSDMLLLRSKFEDGIEAIKKKHGLTAEELGSRMEVDGLPFTVQEAMGIFMVQSNQEHRTAVIEANKIPPETVEKLISMLSEKQQAAAADMAGWFEEIYPFMAAAVLDNSNGAQDLTKVKGVYMPLFRELDVTEDIFDLIGNDVQDRGFFRGVGQPGQVKERTVTKGGGPGRVHMELFDNAYKYAGIASRYIAMQRNLAELSRIVQDKTFKEALRQSKGDAYIKYLEKYMQRISNPTFYKDFKTMGMVARVLREHASVLYIAGNAVTIAKQPLALTFYLGNHGIGVSELFSSIGKYIADPVGVTNFMLEKDPQMASRSVSREAEEQKNRMKLVTKPRSPLAKMGVPVPKGIEQTAEKIVNWSFGGLNWMQTQIDAIGWHAAYDKALLMGKSEMEAIEAGQAAVLETQNAMTPKDAAEIFYTNDWLDLVAQFTDQPNKVYNILTKDIPVAWKRDDKAAAVLAVFGAALGTLLHALVTRGDVPDDPEEWAKLVGTETFNLVPLVGPTATSIYQHYNGSPAGLSVPAVAVVDMAQAAEAIAEGDYEKAFSKILRPLAVVSKLPYPKTTVRDAMQILKFLNEQLFDNVWSF